jgi:hypothetical protein
MRIWHSTQTWAITTFGPALLRWWGNPLLHEARAARPLPWAILARAVPICAALLAILAAAAWALNERTLGAVMVAGPPGVVMAAFVAAPVAGVRITLAQIRESGRTPRGMTTAVPIEIVWGAALVALWRLRWLIVAALIVSPALVIGLLHLDVAAFNNYRETVLALGSAAPLEQVRLLTPGAGIPYFRLFARALSAGLLPWVILPLLASLGVTSALVLRDDAFSLTLALIASLVALVLVIGVWQIITTAYFLGQALEIVRLILTAGVLVGAGGLTVLVCRVNADLLVNIPDDEGII